MKFKQTLRNRLVIAFFLLTLTLCGTFGISVFSIVQSLESDLFYRHLEQDAEWLINSAKNGIKTDLPSGIKLYVEKENQSSDFPSYLKDLKKDHTEVLLDNESFHVVFKKEGDTRYYLVQNQSQFESLEQSIGWTIAIGFVIALAGSIWLGFVTANRIIAPVIELSNRVENIDFVETNLKDFAKDYSNDEVGQLATTFGQYAQKLQGFLEREKLFTGDVSHELRTPLMVISSSCELLLEKSDNEDKRHEAVERIHKSSKEMRLLVNTFLTLSRDNANSTSTFSNIQAGDVIQEEIKEICKEAESKKVKTHFNSDASLNIYGNPLLFRVVIKNLLRNAIYHTKQGTITVSTNPDSIFFEDTGQGIPEELKDSIFERHYQISSLEKESKGQGLGLSIVKRICNFHNWNIQLESVEPHGTRFILTFLPPTESQTSPS